MPKAITQTEMNKIAAMIRDWPRDKPFKWEAICKGASSILSYEPSRQALARKPMLVNAYTTKKKQRRLAVDRFSKIPKPQSILDAMEKIARLQDENQLLRAELTRMAEIANRFIYNASIAGLSREKLMSPLPTNKGR